MERIGTQDPYRALRVLRYHTWPTIGEQRAGEHSAQLQLILLAVWPEAPRHMLVHCLTHDLGEVVAGDPPYPSKRVNPGYKRAHAEVEHDTHIRMCLPWGVPPPENLTDQEALVFKVVECLEWAAFGAHQVNLGNRYYNLVRDRGHTFIEEMLAPTPPGSDRSEVPPKVAQRVRWYMDRRAAEDENPS